MALTPEDVVKKEFSKPKGFGRSGYDEIQVDDFLDEIVVELRRLNSENDTLSDKLDDCRRGQGGSDADATVAGQPGRGAAAVPALTPVGGGKGSSEADKAEIERLKNELAKAREAAAATHTTRSDNAAAESLKKQVAELAEERDSAKKNADSALREAQSAKAELDAARKRVSELEGEVRSAKDHQGQAAALAAPAGHEGSGDAAGVLALAQRLHDQHVKDGENERDRLIGEAKAHHEKVVGDANSKSEELLSSAQKRHDELLSTGQKQYDELVSSGQRQHDELVAKGQKQHDELVSSGQDKSIGVVAQAEERRKAILADLETRRTSLTSEITRLKGFEADYRSNLKGYLSEQLRKLDDKDAHQEPSEKRS